MQSPMNDMPQLPVTASNSNVPGLSLQSRKHQLAKGHCHLEQTVRSSLSQH